MISAIVPRHELAWRCNLYIGPRVPENICVVATNALICSSIWIAMRHYRLPKGRTSRLSAILRVFWTYCNHEAPMLKWPRTWTSVCTSCSLVQKHFWNAVQPFAVCHYCGMLNGNVEKARERASLVDLARRLKCWCRWEKTGHCRGAEDMSIHRHSTGPVMLS